MEHLQNVDQDTPNIHSEHIKEEFYKWFESRGLLSDLRAYMRQLMVKALEESNKNNRTNQQRKASTSPKVQAINLLVVDYLFHEDYLYTVSVFSSEAQILDSLPQYSSYITQSVNERRWDPSSLPRFSQQETEDILDTLRLPPLQREARQATHLYLSGHESLLTCVVRTLASTHSLGQEHIKLDCLELEVNAEDDCAEYRHQLWSKEMQELLLLAGVKLQHIRRMEHKWAQIMEQEKLKAKKETENKLVVEQEEWQQALEQRLRAELLDGLRAEQQQLRESQSRVELREQGLAGLAEQLTAVHDDINNRLSQLQSQREELHEREVRQESDRVQLEERLSRLKIREEHLDLAVARFREETVVAASNRLETDQETTELEDKKKNTMTIEVSTQVEEVAVPGIAVCTQTLDPGVEECTQTLDTEDHEQQTSSTIQPDPNLLLQLQTDREKINELQEENLELRAHALQQRHRIDELTNRAANLSSQLEESRVSVAVLSGQESAVVATPTNVPHPAPVPFAPTFGYNSPQRIGAGEESLFAPRPQQAIPRSDGRRRPLRFAFSQNPTLTSEESSPTDEVIQNARTRIRQLEDESAAVQRSYQEFQTRLLTSDSVMFPPLTNPSRIPNPIMRVRRNDVTPFVPLTHAPYPPVSLNRHYYRVRQTLLGDEENEDSSSDQAAFYETGRIENLTNSRRMFSYRNIRQFERWKQFKKKFQRRDSTDHNRRNLNMPNSNTSSDDDDGNFRNSRKKNETNKFRRVHESQDTNNTQIHCPSACTSLSKNKEYPQPEKDQVQVILPSSKTTLESKSEEKVLKLTPPGKSSDKVASEYSNKPSNSVVHKPEENEMKLDFEQSVKLIESVKHLLEAQYLSKPTTSTISNGSLALESSPRDTQKGSQNEIALTDDSSVLTIQSVTPCTEKDNKMKVEDNENKTEPINNPSTAVEKTSSSENYFKSVLKEIASEHSNRDLAYEREEKTHFDLQENTPAPLTLPTLRLVSPGMNVKSEDLIATVVINSSDVAEQESGDGEMSVTSGSDILRELNPSKTESSDSVISTGWAEDSKHSSDFWN